MGSTGIFIKCVAILILANVVTFLLGVSSSMIDFGIILSAFISAGVIAVLISIIPLTSSATTTKWLMSTVIVASILYHVGFNVMGHPIGIGVGLVTFITNLFSSNPNNFAFIPWIFFNLLGGIALISGILAMGGGGGD